MQFFLKVLSLSQGVLHAGCGQKTPEGRRPLGILIRWLKHSNWLLSTWRNSGSTLRFLLKSKILIQLRPISATLRRKLSHLRLWYHSFDQHTELMTTGDWELCPPVLSSPWWSGTNSNGNQTASSSHVLFFHQSWTAPVHAGGHRRNQQSPQVVFMASAN